MVYNVSDLVLAILSISSQIDFVNFVIFYSL